MKKRYMILMAFSAIIIVGFGYKTFLQANWFDDLYKSAVELGQRGQTCAEIIPAAAELAVKRGKLELEIKALQTEMAGRTTIATVGRFSAETVAELGQFIGKIVGKIANVTYAKISGNVADLQQGKLPELEMDIIIAGEKRHIQVKVDLRDKLKEMKSIFEALKNVPGLA
jgi:hypothetical protein